MKHQAVTGKAGAPKVMIGALLVAVSFGVFGAVAMGQFNDRSDASTGSAAGEDAVDGIGLTPGSNVDPGMQSASAVVALWERRIEANSRDQRSHVELGRALARQAREEADLDLYGEAEAAFDAAIDLNPSDPQALIGRGRAMLSKHEFTEEVSQARRVLSDRPDNEAALLLLGDALIELGEVDEATAVWADFDPSIEAAPAMISRRARLAYATGDPQEAAELAGDAEAASRTQALSSNESAFYWFQLGIYRGRTGRSTDAVNAFETALSIEPGHLGAREALAGRLTAMGRIDEAIAHYETLIEAGAAADLHGSLASLYQESGRDAEADEQLELGVALAEDTASQHPAERRHLVGFFRPIDPQRAFELAAVDAEVRSDAASLDTLAWAHVALGTDEDLMRADTLLAEARATGIVDAAILAHSGLVALELDRPDDARRWLEESVALDPHFDAEGAALVQAALDRMG